MKKNTMMRVASVLLVAVLLSTCAISGTFAKYVTSVDGSDNARVAKWGIGSNIAGANTFSTTYNNGMIASSNQEDVVAPGASSTAGIYKLSGTPETAYQVTFDFTKNNDIFLNAGTYTCLDGADNYEVEALYNPIQWTVTLTTTNGSVTGALANAGNGMVFDDLDAVATAIDGTKIDFEANEQCDVTITIAWDWAFEAAQNANDAADTVLGNLAAGSTVKTVDNAGAATDISTEAYSLNVNYKLVLTATQVNAAPQNPSAN